MEDIDNNTQNPQNMIDEEDPSCATDFPCIFSDEANRRYEDKLELQRAIHKAIAPKIDKIKLRDDIMDRFAVS